MLSFKQGEVFVAVIQTRGGFCCCHSNKGRFLLLSFKQGEVFVAVIQTGGFCCCHSKKGGFVVVIQKRGVLLSSFKKGEVLLSFLKLAAKPVQYDNDEKTWLEFRFKLENYLTLVDERYVGLLLDAESQPVANLPTGTEESAVTIRTLSHTLYALLATLTTGRSLRLVQRVSNRNGFEVWRQRRPRTRRNPRVGDSRCCKLCYNLE